MKIQTFPLAKIQYKTVAYEASLLHSLQRIGQSFPIKVYQEKDGTLRCVDGHKRCSAIADLLKIQPNSNRINIQVVISNIARSSSTTTMNHH